MKSAILSQGKMRVVNIPGLGSYDLTSGQGYTSGEYAKSAWAFRCMQIRATELAALPWRIVRNGEVVERHEVLDWLTGFGPESNFTSALSATEIDLLLKGAGYWLKDVDRLTRLNPNTIKVKRDRVGIQGFIQTIAGVAPQTFAREDVVYFREFHPTDDLGPGVPIMSVVKTAVLAEYEASRYVQAFFENDAMPGLLLSTERDVQKKFIDDLLTWWVEKFSGRGKHHKVAFMDKGFEAKILTSNLREMALKDVRDQARRDICAGFGVPMILAGSMDEATYANAQEARKHLLIDVVIPRSRYYADVINEELVAPIDPSVKFEFATEELSILQEDTNAKAERLGKLFDQQIISAEFVRAELGYPETSAPKAVAQVEEGQFERKALRAVRDGKPANVAFEAVHIPPERMLAIRAVLSIAMTEAQVRDAFNA
jgi:HK97 family phage portal protein